MRAARNAHDGVDRPVGEEHGLRSPVERVDDLLHRDDRPPRGEHDLLLNADDAPQLYVPLPVGLLRVDDADIGAKRRNGCE